MKKTVYICLLLLVLSCTSREKPYSCKLVELQDLNTFPVIDLTPTSIALTDTTLLNPEKIWISDTLLIIKDAETDENKFLKYYSLNSFHLLKAYGGIGRGPNEYLTPRVYRHSPNKFLIIEKLRYTLFCTDSLFSNPLYTPKKTNVRVGLTAADCVYLINDSTIFANSGMSDYQFSIANISSNRYLLNYKNYPSIIKEKKITDFIANSNIYHAFYILKPHTMDSVAIIHRHFPIIDIISLNNLESTRYQFPINKSVNKVTVLDKLNARVEEEVNYYKNYFSTDNYIYLLYCDSKNKDLSISNNNFEIHQFDWQGRFLKRYRLNRYILSFCVDEKSDRIYAISFQNNKNFSPEILCYSLSSTN